MPIYPYRCINGHGDDLYASVNERHTQTMICKECQNTMGRVIAGSQALLYFEEGRGRWINNMTDHPVFVRSHSEHKRLMKKYGVELAGQKIGRKGAWA